MRKRDAISKSPYLDAAMARLSFGIKSIAAVGARLRGDRVSMDTRQGSPGDAKRRAKARARRQMAARSRSANRARERRLR